MIRVKRSGRNPCQKREEYKPRELRDYQLKMVFIVPVISLLIVMNIFPLLWSLYLSFHRYSAIKPSGPVFIGTRNYSRILTDPTIWRYFTTTAYFVVLSVSAQFLIGFGLALLLNRKFKAKGLITTLLLIPMMLSPVVVGLFWKFILDANWGLLNYFLTLLFRMEGKIVWLTNPKLALVSLVIVDTWMWSPFIMLLSLAGLSAVPQYLYEAAEIDRASAWFRFRRITLPLIFPLLLLALLFRTIEAFKLFDLVWVLTAGGPGTVTETVSMNLYRIAFARFKTGQASAFGYIVLIMIIALSSIYINYLNKARERV